MNVTVVLTIFYIFKNITVHVLNFIDSLFQFILIYYIQGVTMRCRLSWLTNSAFVYEPKCGGGGGLRFLSQ